MMGLPCTPACSVVSTLYKLTHPNPPSILTISNSCPDRSNIIMGLPGPLHVLFGLHYHPWGRHYHFPLIISHMSRISWTTPISHMTLSHVLFPFKGIPTTKLSSSWHQLGCRDKHNSKVTGLPWFWGCHFSYSDTFVSANVDEIQLWHQEGQKNSYTASELPWDPCLSWPCCPIGWFSVGETLPLSHTG